MKTTISFGRFVKTAMNLKEMYPVQRWSLGIRKVKETSSLTILPRILFYFWSNYTVLKIANQHCLIFVIPGLATSSRIKIQVYGNLLDSNSHSKSSQSAQTQENKHSYFYIQARDLPPIGNNTSILCKM
jgi:hypothetical protein